MDIANLFRNDKIDIDNDNVKVNIFFYDERSPFWGMNIDQSSVHSESQFIAICYDDENCLILVPKRDIRQIEIFAGEES